MNRMITTAPVDDGPSGTSSGSSSSSGGGGTQRDQAMNVLL